MTRHSGSGRDIARELSPQSRSHPNEKLRGARHPVGGERLAVRHGHRARRRVHHRPQTSRRRAGGALPGWDHGPIRAGRLSEAYRLVEQTPHHAVRE